MVSLQQTLSYTYRIANCYQEMFTQRLGLAFKLGAQFYLDFHTAMMYIYLLLHHFRLLPETYKAVLAFLSPLLLVLPKAITRLCAEKLDVLDNSNALE